MNKLLIVLAVAACLIAAIALNIKVATGCDFVQSQVMGTGNEVLTLRLGVFNYATERSNGSPSLPVEPSAAPSHAPTEVGATARPTALPTTGVPSFSPTQIPTGTPSALPSLFPSVLGDTPRPSNPPTTATPSSSPTIVPTLTPTLAPSPSPTTQMPSQRPSTDIPTVAPTTAAIPESITPAPTFPAETPAPTFSGTTTLPTVSSAPSISPAPTTFTSSPTVVFRRQRWLQDNNMIVDDTEGECAGFDDLQDDNNDDTVVKSTAAQIGAILAPLAGMIALILVAMTPIVVRSARQKLPYLLWPAYCLCQVGTGLLWTVLTVEQCQNNDTNNNTTPTTTTACTFSREANMTIAAHVLYAIAALASCALPTAEEKEHANENDNNNNNNNNTTTNEARDDKKAGRSHDDEDGFTLINTALLDAPTVGGDDDRIDELQAALEAQQMAHAMEAGKAQGLQDQLQEQLQELEATQQELWRAKQEAEEQRDALAAVAAATETADALRAQELEEQLQQQKAELQDAKNIMEDMEEEIDKKEAMIAALAAKGRNEAAAAEVEKVKQLQRELEAQKDEYDRKLRALQEGPERSYYPAVWKWLGFKDPLQKELAYYPEVWSFLGFIEPSQEQFTFKKRAPDPDGLTWKELQQDVVAYEAMIKSLEAQKEALDAAASATAEAQALKDELDHYKKQLEEIKNKADAMKQDDPPMFDPPVQRRNPAAKQPSGRMQSELTSRFIPRVDPPEEMVADPAHDPTGVRNSKMKDGGEFYNPRVDPPDRTPVDPANDPDSKHIVDKTPAADPPREYPAAIEPVGVRRSAVRKTPAIEPGPPPGEEPPVDNQSDEPRNLRRSTGGEDPSPFPDNTEVESPNDGQTLPVDSELATSDDHAVDDQVDESGVLHHSAGGIANAEPSEVESPDGGQTTPIDSDVPAEDEPPVGDQVDQSADSGPPTSHKAQ